MPPQALNKIRFERLADMRILDDELMIRLIPHKAKKTLSIIDNGVGMTKYGRKVTMFYFHFYLMVIKLFSFVFNGY